MECDKRVTTRRDWNWQPAYDVDRFFDEYFLPEIRKRYKA